MTGLELTAKIYAKEIENGTKIRAIKENGDIVNLEFRAGKLNWEIGTFNTGFLFDKNVKFEIVEEEKGWFKPKEGEEFWFITKDGNINTTEYDGNYYGDRYMVLTHNCFRSKEEAREYLEYKKALRETEKPFKRYEKNYFIQYDTDGEELYCEYDEVYKTQGTTYLGQDKEVAQAFIDEWKDCILKYEFDVWE